MTYVFRFNINNMTTNIYILKLENYKYYVGKTDNVGDMYKNHLNGIVRIWTKINKPISIIRTINKTSPFDEDKYVKEYMVKYGIENVRGGSYNQIKLNEENIRFLEKKLNIRYDDKYYECNIISIDNYINYFKECSIDILNKEITYLYELYGNITILNDSLNGRKELLVEFDEITDYNIKEHYVSIEKYHNKYCIDKNNFRNSINDITIKYYECLFEYNDSVIRIATILNNKERRIIGKEKDKNTESMECEKYNTNVDNIDLDLLKCKLKEIMKFKYLLINK